MGVTLAQTRCIWGRIRRPASTVRAVPPTQRYMRLIRAECEPNSRSCAFKASRRQVLSGVGVSVLPEQLQFVVPGFSQASECLRVMSDTEGFGQHAVKQGDLVLIHYIGTLEETGQVFDSTRGGLKYRDGGQGVYRPLAFRLSGDPQPGICEGLQQAIIGMKIGGQRTVVVPAEQGFGSTPVLAPYAAVPANSTLQYEVELLRVSARGPDEMMKGISQCSAGGGKCISNQLCKRGGS